jgi:hypothetical protein
MFLGMRGNVIFPIIEYFDETANDDTANDDTANDDVNDTVNDTVSDTVNIINDNNTTEEDVVLYNNQIDNTNLIEQMKQIFKL